LPRVPIKPLYKSAKAKLYCGDARSILPLLLPSSIDCIITDPPYGHSNNDGKDLIGRIGLFRGKEYEAGSTSEGRPIANDKDTEASDLVYLAFQEFSRLLMPGACCCCCGGGGGPDPQFARWSLWLDEFIGFKQMVVWDKGPMGMGWHYRRSYETILVAEKPGAACRWYAEASNVENILRPLGRCRKIIPQHDDHPCQKPIALAEHFLRLHTKQGDLVLDPFMGHGWVGEACMRLNRNFIGVELDKGFYAQAEKNIRNAEAEGPINLPDIIREPTFEQLGGKTDGSE